MEKPSQDAKAACTGGQGAAGAFLRRQDEGLAFLLRYENVAWYEKGKVRVLDRRVYPMKVRYVECQNHREVAEAIRQMVTQSGGPFMAAAMGMALGAYEAKDKSRDEFMAYMKDAAYTLSHSRPTTARKMEAVVKSCLSVAEKALAEGVDVDEMDEILFQHAIELTNRRYLTSARIGKYFVSRIPHDATIMTQCFAETIIGMILRECHNLQKHVKLICPETRPYLQGSRLTASVAFDMGFDVTVITDNMPGFAMKLKKVDVFTSAADVICLDGHIVNKIGTFQIALAANYWGIPYLVAGNPDPEHPTIDTVRIEEKDGDLVLRVLGTKTVMEGVRGFYPAFDITPPDLCSGVVTDRGIFSPFDLKRYFDIQAKAGK